MRLLHLGLSFCYTLGGCYISGDDRVVIKGQLSPQRCVYILRQEYKYKNREEKKKLEQILSKGNSFLQSNFKLGNKFCINYK